MNRSTVIVRNSFFFYISFFTAGTQTIVTQMYLLKHYPAEKAILLPAILLLGALTGITGAFVSRKFLKVKTSALTIGFLNVLTCFLLFSPVEHRQYLPLYIVLHCRMLSDGFFI